MSIKLTDTQLLMLSAAAQGEDRWRRWHMNDRSRRRHVYDLRWRWRMDDRRRRWRMNDRRWRRRMDDRSYWRLHGGRWRCQRWIDVSSRRERLYLRCSRLCASAISGISGVGEKPSRAGARTAWASAGRPIDW